MNLAEAADMLNLAAAKGLYMRTSFDAQMTHLRSE